MEAFDSHLFPDHPQCRVRRLDWLLDTGEENENNALHHLNTFLNPDDDWHDETVNPCPIAWLSSHFFLTRRDVDDEEEDRYSFKEEGLVRELIEFQIESEHYQEICIDVWELLPSEDGVGGLPAHTAATVVDAISQLLAQQTDITGVAVSNNRYDNSTLPLSTRALEALVGQAQSRREVQFKGVRLSHEQCRVLAFGCNEHVSLDANMRSWNDDGASLIEALTLNNSPAKLVFRGFSHTDMPNDKFQAFLAALEVNTSLYELRPAYSLGDYAFGNDDDRMIMLLDTRHMRMNRLRMLLDTISRNKGLRRISFDCVADFVDHQWQHLWNSVSSHPTLESINISTFHFPRPRLSDSVKRQRDSFLARSIYSDSYLTEIRYDGRHHSQEIMEHQVNPVLEFNRSFPDRIQDMKKEPNQAHRGRLFAEALLDERLRDRTSFAFLLLTENADLLVRILMVDDHRPFQVVVEAERKEEECGRSGEPNKRQKRNH